jgi:hypothetical protein
MINAIEHWMDEAEESGSFEAEARQARTPPDSFLSFQYEYNAESEKGIELNKNQEVAWNNSIRFPLSMYKASASHTTRVMPISTNKHLTRPTVQGL